jgi:hypothetical protein
MLRTGLWFGLVALTVAGLTTCGSSSSGSPNSGNQSPGAGSGAASPPANTSHGQITLSGAATATLSALDCHVGGTPTTVINVINVSGPGADGLPIVMTVTDEGGGKASLHVGGKNYVFGGSGTVSARSSKATLSQAVLEPYGGAGANITANGTVTC